MDNYTIAEHYTLPSKGKLYNGCCPDVKLRAMTTEDEMRRLSPSDTPYRVLCDLIEGCIVDNKFTVSVYDMCLGDFQYLLHKLRVVTYGTDYPIRSICPYCGTPNSETISLDDMKVIEFDESLFEDITFKLPVCGRVVKLKLQTPRDLDEISKEMAAYKVQFPDSPANVSLLFNLKHLIDTIDGKKLNSVQMDMFLRKLNMRDTNAILQRGAKITSKVGLDTTLEHKCVNAKCGAQYTSTFRITNEFFGPTYDF